MRIKNCDKFFKYQKINDVGVPEIPDHYVKYIEPVNSETQNTVEKCWSCQEKLYEISEEKKNQCKELKIDVSPSDFEWVIDIWEKTAINDQ